MAKSQWSQTEKKVYLCMYGIVVGSCVVLTVAKLIEACRSRPKIQVLAFGVKPKPEPEKEEKPD